MKGNHKLKREENPRFDSETGRPFVMDGDRKTLTFTRVYLDSDEIEFIGDVHAMIESMNEARVGTRDELREYLERQKE